MLVIYVEISFFQTLLIFKISMKVYTFMLKIYFSSLSSEETIYKIEQGEDSENKRRLEITSPLPYENWVKNGKTSCI